MSSTPATAVRSTRRAVALAVEHGVDDFYQGVVPALVPLLIIGRGYDYTHAGGIVLAATLLSSLAQPLFGVLADRARVPGLRSTGLLTAGAGIGAVGVVESYPATWCAVLVSGLGIAAYHPEAARAVHATGTADRGMGWFTFGGLAGFATGPPATAAVLGGLGLAASPLLFLPALTVALVTATIAVRGRTAPAEPETHLSRSATGERPAQDWRRFGWLTAVVMVRSVLYYGISVFLVIYLTGHLAASTATAAAALTAFTVVGALSVLASSRITVRLGRAHTLIASYAAALFALTALLAAPSPALAIIAAGMLGAALSIPVPVHTTLGQSYLPRHLGLSSAVTLGLAVSAGGIASPALGALADHYGVTPTLTALLILPALAATLALPLRGRADRLCPDGQAAR